jgi:protein gp37
MSENSKIEWTDHTFNPWIGCTKVSPGCDHCYAEARMDNRLHVVNWGAGQPRKRTSAENWREPIKWNARKFYECSCGWRGHEVSTEGTSLTAGLPSCPVCDRIDIKDARQRVFCASLADVFDNEVPREWRYDLLWLISNTPNLDWLLLTKRIGNAHQMLTEECARMGFPWSPKRWHNVWIGATICNQEEADRDIPKLLRVPAAVRFLSMEPLLGAVSLSSFDHDFLEGWAVEPACCGRPGYECCGYPEPVQVPTPCIDWVIVGGESGPHARPMVLGWAKEIVSQCQSAHVPVFMKQLGANPTNREGITHPISDRKGALMEEWPEVLRVQQFPEVSK